MVSLTGPFAFALSQCGGREGQREILERKDT